MDAVKIGNQLTYTNIGQLCIGIMDEDPKMREKLEKVANLFDRTAIPYKVEADIRHRLWSKFMLNVGVNQIVMIYEGNYGTVQRQGEARQLMIEAMEEARVLANLEGINVSKNDLDQYVNLIDTLDPEGMPSMRQDGLLGRKTELDLFAGTVLKLAKKYKVKVPVNQMIFDRVKEMEQALWGQRGIKV